MTAPGQADEYTPTEDEVRGVYAVAGFRGNGLHPAPHQDMDAWRAEFDRFLAGFKADNFENLGDVLTAQFTSGIIYRGEEVIGRIRAIIHALEPHDGDAPCIVCDNDPGTDYVVPGSDQDTDLLIAFAQAQAVEEFGSTMGGKVQDAAMKRGDQLRRAAANQTGEQKHD